MNIHEKRQREYQAKRPRLTPALRLIDYRVYLPDGRELLERAPDLAVIGKYFPEAIKVERVDACGGFY